MNGDAVLAERRDRKKWSLNPRGTLWANDDNKIGQKLMEKMGWSKGRGLGRELQGDRDHVCVKFKNDSKGVGYKGKDDEWIKHYEGFESVLASLNSEENSIANSKNNSTTNSDANSDDEDTVMKSENKKSLEKASKSSRARVHYHKFVRGKDLSRYSADDIACVLGSKRAKILAEAETKSEVQEDSEVGEKEHYNGVTVIKGGTIQDYFAQKLEALKNRSNNAPQILEEKAYQDNIDDEPARPGFDLGLTACNEVNETDTTLHDDNTPEVPVCKKKKKKKNKDIDEDSKKSEEGGDEVNELDSTGNEKDLADTESHEELLPSKKKKKKRKQRECEEVVNGRDVLEDIPADSNKDIKKRKKRKNSNYSGEKSSPMEEHLPDDENISKPKKKKKQLDIMTAVEEGSVECAVKATDDGFTELRKAEKKKKIKHSRVSIENEVDSVMTVGKEDCMENERKAGDDDSAVIQKKNKKRKKDKDRESVNGQSTGYNQPNEINHTSTSNGHDVPIKKSKKKKHN